MSCSERCGQCGAVRVVEPDQRDARELDRMLPSAPRDHVDTEVRILTPEDQAVLDAAEKWERLGCPNLDGLAAVELSVLVKARRMGRGRPRYVRLACGRIEDTRTGGVWKSEGSPGFTERVLYALNFADEHA